MLNMFLCTGRGQVDDYDYNFGAVDSPSRSPSRKKGSFGASGKRRATITKLQISAPSDFRHESHMGYEEVSMHTATSMTSNAGGAVEEFEFELTELVALLS